MVLVLDFVFGTYAIRTPGQLVIIDLEKIREDKVFID
jgi:hypothetical protein